jgi:hypothetical protein
VLSGASGKPACAMPPGSVMALATLVTARQSAIVIWILRRILRRIMICPSSFA